MEEWKKIKIEGYSISNTGKFRNDKTGKILKPSIGSTGYYVVNIKPNGRIGKSYSLKIHRLIAEAFIPNPENKPQINHKDCNRLNNNIENLEWVTNKENNIHAIENDRFIYMYGDNRSDIKLSDEEVKYIRQIYVPRDKIYGARSLGKRFNVSHAQISRIVNHKRRSH
jgi:hypothetical protein